MEASRKVVFHLGGGDMCEENQWPSTLRTPTPTHETPPTTPTSPTPTPQLSQDDIWIALTKKIESMNPIQLFKLIGF